MTGAAVPEEVFLVFRPRAASEGLRWWQRVFTDRHRAHVVALLPAGPARTLVLDHAPGAMSYADARRMMREALHKGDQSLLDRAVATLRELEARGTLPQGW